MNEREVRAVRFACLFPAARTIYYNYLTSGDGAVLGRLDKSGDVSGLASRGTYEKILEIGVLSPKIRKENSIVSPDFHTLTDITPRIIVHPRQERKGFRARGLAEFGMASPEYLGTYAYSALHIRTG